MSIDTRYEHVVLDDLGVPTIAGTTMKVVELALAHLAYGWSPEELYFQFPHLTLGIIHSALAYYWDHEQEFEKDIERRAASVKTLKNSLGEAPLVTKIKAYELHK